ncbi:TEA domain-containing protein [Mycena kentingensis (nom. inval.)]|nr:TEA domain-containing protein [Mycena kentingensis (nom. inval.)]
MYYRDYDDASTASGSSTPPTPSADFRLFGGTQSPPRRALINSGGVWTAAVSHQSETTKEVLQSVLKVRKSWKTLRGGETVWPLELEAALLEGLESYVPDDSRETRLLGRFPRRNRFISDYIFEKTGKRRSAKQVGSRLQQLRESCGGKKLMHLLSPFRQPYPDSSASSSSVSDGPSACTSPVSPILGADHPHPFAASAPPTPRHTVVYIDILPPEDPSPSSILELPGASFGQSSWEDTSSGTAIVHASDRARPLHTINPTVAFVSSAPAALNAYSQFTVYAEDRIMHSTRVPLLPTPVSASEGSGTGTVYSAALVPEYWRTISESPDPTRFTIYQEVLKEDHDDAETLIFSATYKFAYPECTTSRSTFGDERSPVLHAAAVASLNANADMDALLSAASFVDPRQRHHAHHATSSLPVADRYGAALPLYISAPAPAPTSSSWSSAASRETSHSPSMRGPSGDSLCFPSDLTNYVL